MPLSEEEMRMLAQMERALVQEDPKFASALRGTSLARVLRRRAIVAGVGVLLGMALLLAGVILWLPLGVAGFLVMLGAAIVATNALRGIDSNQREPLAARMGHLRRRKG